jgi:hypothetical protein
VREQLVQRAQAARRQFLEKEQQYRAALQRARTIEVVHGTDSFEAEAAWHEVQSAVEQFYFIPRLVQV